MVLVRLLVPSGFGLLAMVTALTGVAPLTALMTRGTPVSGIDMARSITIPLGVALGVTEVAWTAALVIPGSWEAWARLAVGGALWGLTWLALPQSPPSERRRIWRLIDGLRSRSDAPTAATSIP